MENEIEPEEPLDLYGKFPSLWADLKQPRQILSACAVVHDVKFYDNTL